MSMDQANIPLEQSGSHGDDLELIRLGRGLPLPAAHRTLVHEMVAVNAATRPTDVAVVCGAGATTYADLHAWATRIASNLVADGIGAGSRVAVLAEPSAAMVAAVLAILQCGGAYVPLDPAHPDRRIDAVLADAKVAGVVATRACLDRLQGRGLRLYLADAAEGESAFRPLSTPVRPPTRAKDAAYLIYTSGSTGEPKAVLVEHDSLSDSTLARRMVYPGVHTFVLVSPLAFDSSAAGLWGTLTAGGRLVIASLDEVRDPERLVDLIERNGGTQLLCVPSLYEAVLEVVERSGPRLRTLNTVVVAGEALHQALVQRHFASFPDRPVALVNEYGPTEATVWATYRRYDSPGLASIGGPIPGVQLYVLDEHHRLAARGEIGELFIGGSLLSSGYFGRPDATAQVFLPNPFVQEPGARIYRTGDRVRWNSEGTLDFIGRRDQQIKLRGHRVELGAIEAALRAMPGVRDAVVVPNDGFTQLTAFLLASAGFSTDRLREQLAAEVPGPMVPAHICVLERYPLTTSGKIDSRSLRATAEATVLVPPRAASEPADSPDAEISMAERVAAAWGELLARPSVPVDVNFFDLGGHSLLVFKLQDALERHTGSRPTIVSLFRHTTVASQARLICAGETNSSGTSQALVGDRGARMRRGLRQRAEPEALA